MYKRLQIEIQGDVTGDGRPEFKLTPIDIPIADNVAFPLGQALKMADQFDAEPGDGEYDQLFKTRIPVRVNLFVAKLNTEVDVQGKVTIRIKEVDSPD